MDKQSIGDETKSLKPNKRIGPISRRTMLASLGLTSAAVLSGGFIRSLSAADSGNSPFQQIGDLSALKTSDKSSLVNAVNEHHAQLTTIADTLAYRVDASDPQFNGSIQAAVDATPAYGELYFPPEGSPYYFEDIQITKPIFINGMLSEFRTVTNTKYFFLVKGSRSPENYILAAPLKRGDKTLQFTTSVVGIAEGDLIVLRDDATRATDRSPDVNMEVHEVTSVSGHTLVLKDFVRIPKAVSSTSNVYKFNPVTDVYFRNVNFINKEGNTTGTGVYTEYAKDVHIQNMRSRRAVSPAVRFKWSFRCSVDGFDIRDPQLTGSGQGYGLQAWGSSNIQFKNGYTKGLRHATDNNSAFDVLLENIVAYDTTSSTFALSHNGWDSDTTVINCHARGIKVGGYGFLVSGQGASNPYDLTFYGLKMRGCSAQMADGRSQNVLGFSIPVRESSVDGFTGVNEAGDSYSAHPSTYGVYMLPMNNDIQFQDITLRGFNDGFFIYRQPAPAALIPDSMIRIKRFKVSHCVNAIQFSYGDGRSLLVEDLEADHIKGSIFRIAAGKVNRLLIRNVNIYRSPLAKVFFVKPPEGDLGLFGSVENICSDEISKAALSLTSNKKLTYEEMFLNARNGVIMADSAEAVTLAAPFLQDGIFEGQTLTLYNRGAFDVTIPSHAKLLLKSGESLILNAAHRSAAFTWSNGIWYEI